jgi:hypothetical protein
MTVPPRKERRRRRKRSMKFGNGRKKLIHKNSTFDLKKIKDLFQKTYIFVAACEPI